MQIDDLTLGQVKEIQNMAGKTGGKSLYSSYIGKAVFIRTVTMHYTGMVKAVSEKEILISDAAWIADSGRFHDALKNGTLKEVEPYVTDVVISQGAILDLSEWLHDLPKAQK